MYLAYYSTVNKQHAEVSGRNMLPSFYINDNKIEYVNIVGHISVVYYVRTATITMILRIDASKQ